MLGFLITILCKDDVFLLYIFKNMLFYKYFLKNHANSTLEKDYFDPLCFCSGAGL